jgi:hypothetical protein
MEQHTLLSSNNPIDCSSGKVNKTKILIKQIEGNSDGDEIFMVKKLQKPFYYKLCIKWYTSMVHLKLLKYYLQKMPI